MLGVTDEDDMDVVERTELLEPGSVLILCTDGATEARNEAGKVLLTSGFTSIVQTVARSGKPQADWAAQIAQLIAAYRNAPPDDDTLIAALVCPRQPSSSPV